MTQGTLDFGLQSLPNSVVSALPEPRNFAEPRSDRARVLSAAAEESLAAPTMLRKDELDGVIRKAWRELADRGAYGEIAAVFDEAPSVAIARHWWRRLDEALSERSAQTEGVGTHVFALPLIIVLGSGNPGSLAGVVPEIGKIVDLLKEHRALRGNRNFALGNALVTPDRLAIAELGALLRHGADPLALPVTPLAFLDKQEVVHLRLLIGAALATPQANLFNAQDVGGWGMPVAQELARQLAVGGVTVLVLPRPPASLLAGAQAGRLAQRDVAMQLFASNAIRKLRAAVGEPTAVLSAHRLADGGGELRVSLSSPFDPRSAEGFRIVLEPLDRVPDVTQGVVDLLRECRVSDIRMLTEVQPDRDPLTGGPLLFKPENIGPNSVHAFRPE